MVEFKVRGVKADLSKLTIKQRVAYQMLRAIEPTYIKLRDFLQKELNRIANIEAIARGQVLWEKLQNEKRDRALAAHASVKTYQDAVKKRQDDCLHRKGGPRPLGYNDYNLNSHRMIDGSLYVRCGTCHKLWTKTKDFTPPDWDNVLKMLGSSSNTTSSSEIPLTDVSGQRYPHVPEELVQHLRKDRAILKEGSNESNSVS